MSVMVLVDRLSTFADSDCGDFAFNLKHNKCNSETFQFKDSHLTVIYFFLGGQLYTQYQGLSLLV